jgi:DNA-binding PadR family transcriptional regulator
MTRTLLGELEHQVMLALLRLEDGAYTAPIVLELEARTRRTVKSASVYIALRRLEEKGLVDSEMRDPGQAGGRDRRHFRVTADGRQRLIEARDAYERLMDGVDIELPGTS